MNRTIRVLVNPDAPGFDVWWEAAEAVGEAAPGPVIRMVMGADFVEVTEHEAADIEAWASTVKGWNPKVSDNQRPLLFQRSDAA